MVDRSREGRNIQQDMLSTEKQKLSCGLLSKCHRGMGIAYRVKFQQGSNSLAHMLPFF